MSSEQLKTIEMLGQASATATGMSCGGVFDDAVADRFQEIPANANTFGADIKILRSVTESDARHAVDYAKKMLAAYGDHPELKGHVVDEMLQMMIPFIADQQNCRILDIMTLLEKETAGNPAQRGLVYARSIDNLVSGYAQSLTDRDEDGKAFDLQGFFGNLFYYKNVGAGEEEKKVRQFFLHDLHGKVGETYVFVRPVSSGPIDRIFVAIGDGKKWDVSWGQWPQQRTQIGFGGCFYGLSSRDPEYDRLMDVHGLDSFRKAPQGIIQCYRPDDVPRLSDVLSLRLAAWKAGSPSLV